MTGQSGRYAAVSSINPQAIPVSVVLVLSAAMLAGTGGAWSVSQAGQSRIGVSIPAVHFIIEEEKRNAPIFVQAAHQRMLQRVRDAFRLSMTDLAAVFQVSRTAAYDWFKGSGPRAEQMDRLIKFNDYAALVESKGIQRIDLLSKVPLSHGKSLLQLLTLNEGVETAIAEIEQLSLSRSTSMARRRNTSRKEKIYGVDETTSSFSIFE